MRVLVSAGAVLLSSVSIVNAAARTLEYTIEKRPLPVHPELVRRDDVNGTLDQSLLTYFGGQDGTAYYMNITVGTPGQPFTVILDSGSSDLWIPADTAGFCRSKHGCVGGTFDPTKSSSYESVGGEGLQIAYGDGSGYTGHYVRETVQIGDVVVEGVQLGIATTGNGSPTLINTGIMGIGYSWLEGSDEHYPNFLETLVGAGAVTSRLYSIYLNQLDHFGSILFGGVDTEKYDGKLTTLNCLYDDTAEGVANFYLQLDSVSGTSGKGGQPEKLLFSNPPRVIPDTGSTSWEVPTDLYNNIVRLTGVQSKLGAVGLPCDDLPNGTLTLQFSGNGTDKTTLDVPMSSMFRPAILSTGKQYEEHGEPFCLLSIATSSDIAVDLPAFVMGDAVMRSGYWVFDLDNGQVSIGQAKLGDTGKKVAAVEAGADGLKKAVGLANAKDVVQGATIAPTANITGKVAFKTVDSTVGVAEGAQPTLPVSAASDFDVELSRVGLVLFSVVAVLLGL